MRPLHPRGLQARILEWAAISYSRGSSWPRDQIRVSGVGKRILYHEHRLGSPFQPQKSVSPFLGGGLSPNRQRTRPVVLATVWWLPAPEAPYSTSPWPWHAPAPLPKPSHCASENGVLHCSQAAGPCEPSEGLLKHSLEGLIPGVSDSVSPGQGLIIPVSNKCSGDAAGPGTAPWEPLLPTSPISSANSIRRPQSPYSGASLRSLDSPARFSLLSAIWGVCAGISPPSPSPPVKRGVTIFDDLHILWRAHFYPSPTLLPATTLLLVNSLLQTVFRMRAQRSF